GCRLTAPIHVSCPPVPAKSKAVARPFPAAPEVASFIAWARTNFTPSVRQSVVPAIAEPHQWFHCQRWAEPTGLSLSKIACRNLHCSLRATTIMRYGIHYVHYSEQDGQAPWRGGKGAA